VVGTISPDATSRSSSDVESKQFTLSVTYSDPTSSVGSNKLSVMVGVNDSVRDVLEKMYDRLTSSACELWVVSNTGREISLDEHDSVILYHPSVHQFYLIDPVYRVIVVFIGPSCAEYMSLLVKHNITANEV
jgi:transglutaminase/protease-like cytokinesis protein 3